MEIALWCARKGVRPFLRTISGSTDISRDSDGRGAEGRCPRELQRVERKLVFNI